MENEFRKYLQKRKLSTEDIDFAVKAVKEFEEYLEKKRMSFESAELDTLKDYVSLLMEKGENSMDRLIAIARYCNIAKKDNYYVYFASILGARNVLPDLGERLAAIAGEKIQRKVFQDFKLPPLGSPPENYPRLTQMILNRLEAELPSETCRKIFTWNYHRIPAETFKEKKERFEKANSIDDYLKEEHKRFVEELKGFMKEGRIWYEQETSLIRTR